VRDGVLAPDAQAFKVLVVRGNDTLTLDGVSRLVDFANAGLPIVLLGGVSSTYLGTNQAEAVTKSQEALKKATSLPNVHVMDSYDGLASTLNSLGIKPATRLATNATWYTLRRSEPESNVEYYFVYNDDLISPAGGGKMKTVVEFSSTGTPYEFDAWTGEERPILTYTQSDNSTSIPITLAGNQTTLIVFKPEGQEHAHRHIADVSEGILGVSLLKNGSIALKVGPKTSTPPSFTRVDGTEETVTPAPGSPVTLTNWDLTVEHWDPPSNLLDIEGGSVKHNTTHKLPHPVSWQEISGLQNVSGRGYYSSSFAWPPCRSRSNGAVVSGAVIDFGFIAHTLRVSVNGHTLPPLDVTAPKADISEWLVRGVNTVEAVVGTPLGNAVRPVWDQLQTSGTKANDKVAGGGPPAVGEYGLLADVVVTPYTSVVIRTGSGSSSS